MLDQDVEDLNAAADGLQKESGIKNIIINGVNGRFWLNKKVQLTAQIEPADAQEQVFWSSSDTSVVIVDKTKGTAFPVGNIVEPLIKEKDLRNAVITLEKDNYAYDGTKKLLQ